MKTSVFTNLGSIYAFFSGRRGAVPYGVCRLPCGGGASPTAFVYDIPSFSGRREHHILQTEDMQSNKFFFFCECFFEGVRGNFFR